MSKGAKSSAKQCVSIDIFISPGSSINWRIIQLMHSRHAESREAFRLVEERRIDIDRIQKTLAELAQAFNDVCSIYLFLF